MPPLKVMLEAVANSCKSWLLRVMAPAEVGVAVEAVMVAVPVLPPAITMGLAVQAPVSPKLNVALALPLLSPIVMVLALVPKALRLVVPLRTPDLMVKPPENKLA